MDIFDLQDSQKDVSNASIQMYEALKKEKEANIALQNKIQKVRLENMEYLLAGAITAAAHKVQVENETFDEKLAYDTAVYDRKMCSTRLESLKEKHYTIKKELNIQ